MLRNTLVIRSVELLFNNYSNIIIEKVTLPAGEAPELWELANENG